MWRVVTWVALVLAIALPAGAAADTGRSGTPLRGQAPELQVEFTLVEKNDKFVKVTKFRFAGLTITCDQGTFPITNADSPLPKMAVDGKRFRDDFTSDDGAERVGVAGEIKKRGKKVEGKLRVRGSFTDPATGTPLTNCDSGTTPWVARRG